MKFQRGGTILGFIIGVLVGLGGALAVAVYVTKVPVPFVNKGQSRSPEQDAAEIRKNKDWDPNAPLYGKNPARAASAPASGAVAAAAVASAPAAVASQPKPAASAAVKAAADPLGDLAKAKAGAAPANAPAPAPGVAGPDPFTYAVQAGAFRSAEDAEAQRVKLSLLGVEAKVTEREQSGRTVFRVRAGPFDKKEDAEKVKEKLDAAGNDTALVRIQR